MRMGSAGMNGVGTLQGGAAVAEEDEDGSPCRLPPLVLEQAGGGELCGRTTGAKALFCLTAEIILTGENEKPPGGAEAAVPDGSEMEEAPSGGLAGTTAGGQLTFQLSAVSLHAGSGLCRSRLLHSGLSRGPLESCQLSHSCQSA